MDNHNDVMASGMAGGLSTEAPAIRQQPDSPQIDLHRTFDMLGGILGVSDAWQEPVLVLGNACTASAGIQKTLIAQMVGPSPIHRNWLGARLQSWRRSRANAATIVVCRSVPLISNPAS